MPIFGPPDVKKLQEKGNVQKLIKALDYQEDFAVRQKAAQALGDIGDPQAIEPLFAALKNDKHLSALAANALSKFGEPAVALLISAIKDVNYDVSKFAAGALGTISDPRAEMALIGALTDNNSHLRKASAEALGRIGSPRAVEPLITAMKDEDSSVRRASTVALGNIGEPQAVNSLITALKDEPSYHIRSVAAWALGAIGDPRAVVPLIDSLKDDFLEVRKSGAAALGSIGEPSVALLITALNNWDSDVRRFAAETLGKIGNPQAVAPLISALRDWDPNVRSQAKWALSKLSKPAIMPLIDTLQDWDSDVRKSAAEALDKLGWQPGQDTNGAAYWIAREEWDHCIEIGPDAIAPLINALKDKSSKVCEAAADILDRMGWQPNQDAEGAAYWIVRKEWDRCINTGPTAIAPLIAALRNENWDVRQAVARTLKKMNWEPDQGAAGAAYWATLKEWDRTIEIGAEAVAPLVDALKDMKQRYPAAKALSKIGSPAVEPLLAALKNEHWDIGKAAAEALGIIGDRRAVKPLISQLKDKDLGSVITIDALGKIGDHRAVEPLITALRGKDLKLREAAAEALGYFNDPHAVDALIASLNKDDSWRVRCAAAEALGKIGDTRAIEPLIQCVKISKSFKSFDAGGSSQFEISVEIFKEAVKALLKIYQSGHLDENQKQLILENRKQMKRIHIDRRYHKDTGGCYGPEHTDDYRGNHEDKGVSIDFPL